MNNSWVNIYAKFKINGLYSIVSIILFIVCRSLVTQYGIVSDFFFPKLSTLGAMIYTMFGEENFLKDVGYSFGRVSASFLLSTVCALSIGVLFYFSPKVYAFFSPYITFIRYIPVEGVFPLIVLFLGLGESSKIGLLFIGTFFPLLILVIKELQFIPQELRDLIIMLKLSFIQKIKLYLQSIAPQLYDNARVMIGRCRGYVVLSEMIAAQYGIGYTIWQAQKFANIPKVYVAVFTLGIIGFLTDKIIKQMRPYLFPYLYCKKNDQE